MENINTGSKDVAQNNNNLLRIVFLVSGLVLFAGAVGVGVYVISKNQATEENEVEDESVFRGDGSEEDLQGQEQAGDVDTEKTPTINNTNTKEKWETYTNEELGFVIRYPMEVVVMERFHPDLGAVNCVDVGPVDGEQKAFIAVGYDPASGLPNGCFRSGVGAGEQKLDEFQLQIGDEMRTGKRLIYIGDGQEQAYTSYIFHLDNPNMDKGEYKYFAIQVEYYAEYEGEYWEMYQNILKTFEWL